MKITRVEGIFRAILVLELVLIFIIIFLVLTGYTYHPAKPAKINVTTPPTLTMTITATPISTPTPIPTGWYYDPEKGYYVKGPDK